MGKIKYNGKEYITGKEALKIWDSQVVKPICNKRGRGL